MIDTKVREVATGIYQLYLPLPMRPSIVNVYLVKSGDEWALVDTGMGSEESLAAFQEALAVVGCPLTAVRKLLSTHHHPDHFGASRRQKELTGAEVYFHPLEVERIRRIQTVQPSESLVFFRQHGVPLPHGAEGMPTPMQVWGSNYAPTQPDHLIGDGEVIRVGSREVQAIWTPGHSPGHCCFYLPADEVLIVGDHLLPTITPHVGAYPNGPDDPLGDFLNSQWKVQELDVKLVLPAHGAVFTDHRARVSQIIQHHEYRLEEVTNTIRRQPKTAYDIAVEVFGNDESRPLFHILAATFETLAHLHFLVHEELAERIDEMHCTRFIAT
jgi:glyoxylase-like metal-dependent hydrolase (beta-lactamase superfamily II)